MQIRSTTLFIILVCCSLYAPDAVAQDADDIMASSYRMVKKKTNEKVQEIPRSLTRKFRRDAARLALRMEAKDEDLRYRNIVIPRNTIENIYEVLTKVYLTDETAKSIAKCNVHTFPNPSIDHLVIIFDRNVGWAQPLQDGISETESPEINRMLDEYDLIIDKHVQWNDTQDAITIRSKEPLNMSALANEFYNVQGVANIDLGVPKMGGNDINIRRVPNGWEVEYILRFGSYINGKGNMHFWKYQCTDDGQVKFINAGGDPIPDYMRCHFNPTTGLVLKG